MITVKIKFRLTYNIYTKLGSCIILIFFYFSHLRKEVLNSHRRVSKNYWPYWQAPAGDYYIITIFYLQMLGNGLSVLTNAT